MTGLLQPTHLILILVIALIIFGPGKLPDLGKAMGKTVSEFKQSMKDGSEESSAKTTSSEEKKA